MGSEAGGGSFGSVRASRNYGPGGGVTILQVLIALAAATVAYWCGRKRGEHTGWWKGFQSNQCAYDRGLTRGWNEHRQFLERGGRDLTIN